MKRVIAMMLMTVLLLSVSSMSFGENFLSESSGSATTKLVYSVSEHFTVNIPETLNFTGKTATMQVNLEGNITSDVNVTVSSYNYTNNGMLALLKNNSRYSNINYDVYIDETKVTAFPASFTLSLSNNQSVKTIKAEITSADSALNSAEQGDYSDLWTFAIG